MIRSVNSPPPQEIAGINCLSGATETLLIENGRVDRVSRSDQAREELPYVGPGLVDLQVNGINGIDFNDAALQSSDLLAATRYLLRQGVTTFFPTIITNTDRNVHRIIETIVRACQAHIEVEACVGGIHLEGPFISAAAGARGAHDEQHIQPPDWHWVQGCQKIAQGRIKLITLSPESPEAITLIRQCRQHGIRVAIGHTNASPRQIDLAVRAGATLSTHLGNGVPLMLPRHPNLLWQQLAQDALYASVIADGFHLPDAFLKVVIKTKGERTILVSDATRFSGQPAGMYPTHIGDEVVLEESGRLSMKKSPNLLAGATRCLLENVQHLLDRKLATLSEAWKMASVYPARFLGSETEAFVVGQRADLVVFARNEEGKIRVRKVTKNGVNVSEAYP